MYGMVVYTENINYFELQNKKFVRYHTLIPIARTLFIPSKGHSSEFNSGSIPNGTPLLAANVRQCCCNDGGAESHTSPTLALPCSMYRTTMLTPRTSCDLFSLL